MQLKIIYNNQNHMSNKTIKKKNYLCRKLLLLPLREKERRFFFIKKNIK